MQTVRIQNEYSCGSMTDVTLPGNRTWDDVADYWVKWGVLYINWTDGSEWQFDLDENLTDAVDWKRPIETRVMDENYDPIEPDQD